MRESEEKAQFFDFQGERGRGMFMKKACVRVLSIVLALALLAAPVLAEGNDAENISGG